MKPPNSSWLNRMCTDDPLLICKRFFGCSATLTFCCVSTLLGSSGSGNTLLNFLRSGFFYTLLSAPGNCIVTLLDFLLFCFIFFWFGEFFGFGLRGPELLGFLDGFTISFHEPTLSSGSESKRMCPKTHCIG